jgi:tRNA(Ile)-lysidine synthase
MSPRDVPPPSAGDEVDRFRRDLTELLGAEAGGDRPIGLAVSGGPDSVAMLWLASRAFPGRVAAATVDHRLRPDSADEAASVARWCEAASIPHATLVVNAVPGATGNLQAWARQERYLLLDRWALGLDAAALCTAHHADDQAETFLMRAARASGLSGLAGVRARRDEWVPLGATRVDGKSDAPWTLKRAWLAVVRPLLGWRRAELRAICERERLPFVDDPSNADPRFDRTRFRAWLAQAPWLDTVKIARAADNLAGVDDDLHAIGRWLWQQRGVGDDPAVASVEIAGLPRGVTRMLVRIAIDSVRDIHGMDDDGWRGGGNVEGLLDALEAGGKATRAGVLASADGSVWHFREAPPRRSR